MTNKEKQLCILAIINPIILIVVLLIINDKCIPMRMAIGGGFVFFLAAFIMVMMEKVLVKEESDYHRIKANTLVTRISISGPTLFIIIVGYVTNFLDWSLSTKLIICIVFVVEISTVLFVEKQIDKESKVT